jgi:hypothetical protein
MAVMRVTDVGMLVLNRGMLMLMGMPVSPLWVGWALVIPRMIVAVVGVTTGGVVAVTVGMVERLVPMPVGMVFLEQNGDAEQHGG